jgi:DNA-binding MarR family transcriptional regulator
MGTEHEQTRWLDDTEMRSWRNYIQVVDELAARLEGDLVRAHGLTLGDYQVLVYLSESPGHRLRMCDLAGWLRLSPSGLTRRLDGLVKGGLVVREPSAEDRRVSLAVLTEHGFARLERAAPDHVDSVRRHMLDHLDRQQITLIGDAFAAIRAGWAEHDAGLVQPAS